MHRFIPTILLVMACNPDQKDGGGQFGEENGAGCEVTEEVALAMDEVSELGFPAMDLVSLTEGEHVVPLTWADASTATLTVDISGASNPRLLRYEYVDTSGAEPAFECEDTVAVDVDMTFATDDGAFDESWSRTLEATAVDLSTHHVDLDEVDGSFDPWDWADAEYDDVWADAELVFETSGLSGEISGGGEQTHGDPDDPDSAVSATFFPIATFGATAE